MHNLLLVLQIVSSVLLIGTILLQVKGTGLSAAFGGSGEFYQSRRGIEKIVLYATIVLAVIFGLVSVLLLLI